MLDMMEAHDGVFSGVAIVDESQADVANAMKSMANLGVRGFRVYTSRAYWPKPGAKGCAKCGPALRMRDWRSACWPIRTRSL